MIPKRMKEYLEEALPAVTLQNRLQRVGDLAFMEFGPLDVDRLKRLGIEVDSLGPQLVVCLWDEESPLEIGGYLVVDNLSMGQPSMGGIRKMPGVTPAIIHNLARGMTLKNAAADLPYGGGKSGIVASRDLSPEDHREVVRGFARLIARYRPIYLPGPDVGTDDEDMKTIAIENGLWGALSKTPDMGGNCIDILGAAAQGVVVAIETLLEEMPRLKVLPQFADLEVPTRDKLSVLIQGFGAVGTHAAKLLLEGEGSSPRIVGISDYSGYLYDREGLPVQELIKLQRQQGIVSYPYYCQHLSGDHGAMTTFANARDDLLRESAFCLVPAAPVANYLDVDETSNPSVTVNKMGDWKMIVEGANTYSPAKNKQAARRRMERSVYWQKGVLIATDFLVNSGGVIYAAQEHLIKPPIELLIPEEMLGDRAAVDGWLEVNRDAFAQLAGERRIAGRKKLEDVIKRNMREFVDLLVADPDLLPSEAAEEIAINRIARSESGRTVSDLLEPIPRIDNGCSVKDAAVMLINEQGALLAVVDDDQELIGVITDRDITEAAATAFSADAPVREIMTEDVVYAGPQDNILDVVRKLEYYEISAMPVVEKSRVMGLISSDILARKTLFKLLQAKE